MITKDYVSRETYELLKEKGYNGEFKTCYNMEEGYTYTSLHLYDAMKWLREMYDIHVVPKKDFFNGSYTGMIYDGRRENVFDKDDYIALVGCDTYEQSCEEAIKYALKKVLPFENVKIEMHDVSEKDSIMPKVILNDFIKKKKENSMSSYRTNEEIIREFCNENLTTHTDHYGTWVETKNICSSVDEFAKKLMQHIEDNHGKC